MLTTQSSCSSSPSPAQTLPTTPSQNGATENSTTLSTATPSTVVVESRSLPSSISKPFRGLKRILFGTNKTPEKPEQAAARNNKMDATTTTTSSLLRSHHHHQQQQQQQQQQQHKPKMHNRPRLVQRIVQNNTNMSDDDEGVILSGERTSKKMSTAVFLPAFDDSSAASTGSGQAAAAVAGGAVVQQKVRHSSSHRSLSSQSSEKEEGYSSSRASHGSRESIDLDSLSRSNSGFSAGDSLLAGGAVSSNWADHPGQQLLQNEAMKHRIAVRPRRRHHATHHNVLSSSSGFCNNSQGQAADKAGLLELPSLKEEPGYLSNATYTPAPFVVNQLSIAQQLARKNNSVSCASSSAVPVFPTASLLPSAPKIMKQQQQQQSTSCSSSPLSQSNNETASQARASAVQRGIKLPGLEATTLAVYQHHKLSNNSSSSSGCNGAVASCVPGDDELAKVFSRLRKVNVGDSDETTVNNSKHNTVTTTNDGSTLTISFNNNNNSNSSSSSVLHDVELRKSNSSHQSSAAVFQAPANNQHELHENSNIKLKSPQQASSSSSSSSSLPASSAPQTFPKPLAKNLQTRCAASSLPCSSAERNNGRCGDGGGVASSGGETRLPLGKPASCVDGPSSLAKSVSLNNFNRNTSEPAKPPKPSWAVVNGGQSVISKANLQLATTTGERPRPAPSSTTV